MRAALRDKVAISGLGNPCESLGLAADPTAREEAEKDVRAESPSRRSLGRGSPLTRIRLSTPAYPYTE